MYRNRCFPQASTLLSLPEQHRKGRRGTGEGLVPKKRLLISSPEHGRQILAVYGNAWLQSVVPIFAQGQSLKLQGKLMLSSLSQIPHSLGGLCQPG